MDKHVLRSGNIMKLLLIAAISFYTGTGLKGQSFLKKMGNGLNVSNEVNATVNCACVDSLGNIYTVTSRSIDTADVNKWDVVTLTWSKYARLPKFYTYARSTCSFLYGKFYLTGDNPTTGKVELMEYSGTWKKKSTLNYTSYSTGMNSIVFKNKIYISGGFDSIGGAYMPNIATFDGSVFTASGFPSAYLSGGNFLSSFEIVADTLFMTCRDKILKHNSPNTWSTYYTNKNSLRFDAIAYNNGMLYGSFGSELTLIKGGSKIDSLTVPYSNRVHLKSCKNRLFIAGTDGILSNVYTIGNKKEIKFLFTNVGSDSNDYNLITNNTELYYKSWGGVVVNATYYNIVEIIVDSITPIGYDTIRGFVFWDRNNNYVRDTGDAFPTGGYMHNVASNTYPALGFKTGKFEEIVLENISAEYNVYDAYFDSCVRFNFSGNVKSRNKDTGVTIDSMYFPMERPSTSNKNLILRNHSWNRARLVDTIPLTINVRNKDCDFSNTTNGTVTITLDSKTIFVSSVPTYTSKNGNVITFSNLIFDYNTDNFIKLKVVYPNTSYSIGNMVRHYARLSNIAGEDTMDNMDSIVQKMVYSYDPNSKHSVPEGKITKDLKNIRYYIDFQNLGNDNAVRVTVVDTLNLKIPVYEFQMVACSHPYSVSITPGTNIVTWVFGNINLKPKVQDEAASKGYIIFDAKLRTNVKVGDSIRNRAYIYFDYNQPVITNFAVINRVDPKENVDAFNTKPNAAVRCYPNPGQDYINIESTSGSPQNLIVYDVKGSKVATFRLNGMETKKMDTENWSKGLYMLVNQQGEGLKIIIE